MLVRLLGALCLALASPTALADSVAGPVNLAPTADCQSTANVTWSFTYTVNPAREFGDVTNLAGTRIGGFPDQPSPLTGGSFNGTWTQPLTLPQPPNSLIGSYGGAGDNPPTTANTAEFFLLYNCTTRQVLYRCTGNYGTCPKTAQAALGRISEAIPAASPAALAALLLALLGGGALRLRRSSR